MSLKDRLNPQMPQTVSKEFIKAKLEESAKLIEKTSNDLEGLGILEAFLVDEKLNSIYVTGAKNIFLERNGVIQKSTSTFRDNVQLINVIKKNAQEAGINYIENVPYIKFNYKEGINVTATLPPISSVPTMFVKSYHDKISNVKYLEETRAFSKEIALLLEALVSTKTNILVVGEANSLKTTILSALSKLLLINDRGVVVDFRNEIKVQTNNYVSYDFLNLKDEEIKLDILKSVVSSNPNRITINDCSEKCYYEVLNYALSGFKGFMTSINGDSVESGFNNVAQIILKNNPVMNFEQARKSVYRAFDIVILCSKSDSGQRFVSEIAEVDSKEYKINNIFKTNEFFEHCSTGYIPNFYNSLKLNQMPLNSNVFEISYKHTYSQTSPDNFKPSFISKPEQIQPSSNISEDMIKKAQGKFEILKRNAKQNELKAENKENPDNLAEENKEFNSNEQKI